MKRIVLVLAILFVCSSLFAEENEIRLLVRGDDIGFCHSANVACIESYKFGIVRSVELMPPTPWFPEAVKLLNENPGLDVGIHLTMNSEWSNLKWRPLTNAKSITDSNGFFFPMVWKNQNFGKGACIQESDWDIKEIEAELRAQIELSLKHVPHISHLTGHMGFAGLDPKIRKVVEKLSKEYKLPVNYYDKSIKRFPGWKGAKTLEERIDYFIWNLEKLEPGTYIFVDHPVRDNAEARAINHPGYDGVAEDREWVTQVFTNKRVRQAVEDNNIKLITYKDLKAK